MTNLLIVFIILNIFNVIIQTVKSIVTVKCGKTAAALTNAIAFGLYTVVTVYLMCDLALWLKALIVALCNLVGVYVVKWIEEKARKDRLWKVEATIPHHLTQRVIADLKYENLSHNYIENIGAWTIFNIYCNTQQESKLAKKILDYHKAKYFVSESKNL
jgi:uncharacterized protein YebE (UPF0316 family)